ncbi:hypothetical protein [uncultured Aquimarina sp.]|uniref:hypothetical protein n=1 Tax=uncultured Aquimarina sp. TaxID=575652 RepID=UPI002610114C|nr:hypothetical protein [uncultured Aquimarina sp.]
MLLNILKIQGVQKLNRTVQENIKGGDHLNTGRSLCYNDSDCITNHICCTGVCFNPLIAFELPNC